MRGGQTCPAVAVTGSPSRRDRCLADAWCRLPAGHAGAAPVVLADAPRFPFRDGAFDLAVAYMCLHDIDDMPHAVAEIARVLGRSGRLCAAIPHPINTAGSFQGRDAGAPFVISASYMHTAPLRMVVDRGGIRLTFHSEHRPWSLTPRRWRPAACSSRPSGR